MRKPLSVLLAIASAALSISCAAITADAVTIKGDVNGDNRISLRDATMIQKIHAGLIAPSAEQSGSADFDGNGSIEIKDAFCIQKFACLDNEMLELHSPNRKLRVQFYEALNTDRVAMGLDPIDYNDAMMEAGNIRAKEYAATGSHQRPTGSSYSTVFEECNLQIYASSEVLEWGGYDTKDGGDYVYNHMKKDYEEKTNKESSGVYKQMISADCHSVCVGAAPDPDNSNGLVWVVLVN